MEHKNSRDPKGHIRRGGAPAWRGRPALNLLAQALEDYGDLNTEIVPPPASPQKPPCFSPPRVFNPREKTK
tara:strand:- start:121 stop:333 length:213 start_codon:yes stop_codon:yes gene_type:complete